jgi:hypothetical protein
MSFIMFLDIQQTIAHIKLRKITQDQRKTIIALECVFQEVHAARIEANKTIRLMCPTKSAIRKKIIARAIGIRNHIRNYLEKEFPIEINTACHRDVTQRNQTPIWFNEFDKFVYDECVDLCKSRKASTGIDWHVDHMIPLKGIIASGFHCALNFQVIPAYINRSKGNKNIMQDPFEWISFI